MHSQFCTKFGKKVYSGVILNVETFFNHTIPRNSHTTRKKFLKVKKCVLLLQQTLVSHSLYRSELSMAREN